MSKTAMQRLGEVPFVGLLVWLLSIPLFIGELVLALAWILRVLEIGSVFDRWLPGLTTWELFMGVVIITLCLWAVERILHAMKTPDFPFAL